MKIVTSVLPRRSGNPLLGVLLLLAPLLLLAGCAGTGAPSHDPGYVDNQSLAIYAVHMRASDPGLSGLVETWEHLTWGGSDVGGFFEHLEGGVDGWSALYDWAAILFDGKEWGQMSELLELWFLF